VLVIEAKTADVPIYSEYPAQTYARDTVDVRGRVDGYIEKWLFRPGQEVHDGDVLYVLDQRPYEAALAQAKGNVAQTQADHLQRESRPQHLDVNRLEILLATCKSALLTCSNRTMVDIADLIAVVQVRERLSPKWPEIPSHLGSFSDGLYTNPPRKTSVVIALPATVNRVSPDWLTFVAIGRFRAAFSVIEELSRILAPTALNLGAVPQLVPINEVSFQGMTWDTPFVRNLRESGLLLYGRGMQL
jgi:hypothetical protein